MNATARSGGALRGVDEHGNRPRDGEFPGVEVEQGDEGLDGEEG
ncbi:MAG: hypothetical protein SPG17_07700 [Schaalia hyovaginalis]|nr:hypothetical protein [Schaalia hyovaginalis]MDY5506710.1 hypothetical protein [Schaalia hyovaginalis]